MVSSSISPPSTAPSPCIDIEAGRRGKVQSHIGEELVKTRRHNDVGPCDRRSGALSLTQGYAASLGTSVSPAPQNARFVSSDP